MDINIFNVGDAVWVIKNSCCCECKVIGVSLNMLFGILEDKGFGIIGKHQVLSDRHELNTGVKYSLKKIGCNYAESFQVYAYRCFKTKEELLKSL